MMPFIRKWSCYACARILCWITGSDAVCIVLCRREAKTTAHFVWGRANPVVLATHAILACGKYATNLFAEHCKERGIVGDAAPVWENAMNVGQRALLEIHNENCAESECTHGSESAEDDGSEEWSTLR